MGKSASAFFHKDWGSWVVGYRSTSRAGAADSYQTFPSQAKAEHHACEYNAEQDRIAAARKTIDHDEAAQAVIDATEYRKRTGSAAYNYPWFVMRFNDKILESKRPWKWEKYEAAVKLALSKGVGGPTKEETRAAKKLEADKKKRGRTDALASRSPAEMTSAYLSGFRSGRGERAALDGREPGVLFRGEKPRREDIEDADYMDGYRRGLRR